MRFKDKVAVVTGASTGLGQKFAIALAREGAKVMVVDIKNSNETVGLVEKEGGTAAFFQADVGASQDVQTMADAVKRQFGPVAILINNAAVYDGLKRRHFSEIPPEEWDWVMNVNAKGVFLTTQAVYPHMKQQGGGKIINISSETFFSGSNGFVHYVASKGSVVGLTRSLAVELGTDNICINCVAPGFTDTLASRNLASVEKYDTSKTPLKRVGTPEDIIGPVLFFASAESDFVTGQTLLVNGGRFMR